MFLYIRKQCTLFIYSDVNNNIFAFLLSRFDYWSSTAIHIYSFFYFRLMFTVVVIVYYILSLSLSLGVSFTPRIVSKKVDSSRNKTVHSKRIRVSSAVGNYSYSIVDWSSTRIYRAGKLFAKSGHVFRRRRRLQECGEREICITTFSLLIAILVHCVVWMVDDGVVSPS